MLRHCLVLTAATFVGLVAVSAGDEGKPLAGEYKPLGEEQRKAAVTAWRERYDAEANKLKDRLKAATADLAFPVTKADAKAAIVETKPLLTKLERSPFAVMPKLGVRAVAGEGSTIQPKPGLTLIDPAVPAAKVGEVGVLPYAYGVEVRYASLVREDETGSLVTISAEKGAPVAVKERPNKPAIVTGGGRTSTDVQVILVPPLKTKLKDIPIGGLWRTAGIVEIDGQPVAVFQRVEPTTAEMPKK